MKKIILFLYIVLSIQNLSAEEIQINKSLLKYIDKNLILEKRRFIYPTKDYFAIMYEGIQYAVKNNENFTVSSFTKGKFTDFDNCIKEYKTEIKILKKKYPLAKSTSRGSPEKPVKHWADKQKESLNFGTQFILKNGDQVVIECIDWSERIEKEQNFGDSFKISYNSAEFNKYKIKNFK